MVENGQTWCRENIHVKPWACMISTDTLFLCFQNIEDFIRCCAILRINTLVWYNGKFDFALFDNYFLKNNWKYSQEVIEERQNRYGKLPDKTYTSLQSSMGARYKLSFWKSYLNKNRATKVHKTDMIDLLNVLQGGLEKNLADWDIKLNNENIRKLEMDYVNATFDNDSQYLINDTLGLYLLTKKFNDTFEELTSFSYLKGDFMTSGGVAKKVMLTTMYNCEYKKAIKKFHEDFYMSIELDQMMRDEHLYLGGKTLLNPKYKYKICRNVYKLDENSMYPHKEKTMDYPYGRPTISQEPIPGKIHIYHLNFMYGKTKPHMIGVWADLKTKDYTDEINELNSFFIYEEELNELKEWYDLYYEVDYILNFRSDKCKGMKDFIDKFYSIKCTAKGVVKLAVKIPLNASYGKLSEKIIKETGHYELSEGGYVHYVKDGETVNKNSMLSVIVGSRVTALSRVDLMQKIRQVTYNNPEENFIYCDTDSIHSFTCNIETDDKKLGYLKNEAPDKGTYDYAYYIAPKSYIMLHKSYSGDIDDTDGLVVHCKGVNTKSVRKLIYDKKFDDMIKIFRPNYPISCLTGINAIGGKALIYKDKFILKDDNYGDYTANDGGIFYEL